MGKHQILILCYWNLLFEFLFCYFEIWVLSTPPSSLILLKEPKHSSMFLFQSKTLKAHI